MNDLENYLDTLNLDEVTRTPESQLGNASEFCNELADKAVRPVAKRLSYKAAVTAGTELAESSNQGAKGKASATPAPHSPISPLQEPPRRLQKSPEVRGREPPASVSMGYPGIDLRGLGLPHDQAAQHTLTMDSNGTDKDRPETWQPDCSRFLLVNYNPEQTNIEAITEDLKVCGSVAVVCDHITQNPVSRLQNFLMVYYDTSSAQLASARFRNPAGLSLGIRMHHISARAAKSYCQASCDFDALSQDTWVIDCPLTEPELKAFFGSKGHVESLDYVAKQQFRVKFGDCRWTKSSLMQFNELVASAAKGKAHVTLCAFDETLWLTLYHKLPADTILKRYADLPRDCSSLIVEETASKPLHPVTCSTSATEESVEIGNFKQWETGTSFSARPFDGTSVRPGPPAIRPRATLSGSTIASYGSLSSATAYLNAPSAYLPQLVAPATYHSDSSRAPGHPLYPSPPKSSQHSSSPPQYGRQELPVFNHNKNYVDYAKVLSDEDTRSTFMIRNIPNKYTQKMMIDMVNESHFRTYDFFYLRMDFINHCNCGYAFINFIDPKSIISFARRFVGKKWDKFESDKVCSIRYADYQGKHRLVEHFRNSNVMLMDPSYRPKSYFTSGPLKGYEEPFPEPTIHLSLGKLQDSLGLRD